MKRTYVRIVAVPPGEAPEDVRQAWVGLRLPLLLFHGKSKSLKIAGVLTGPKGFLDRLATLFSGRYEQRNGYAISVLEAIAVLEGANPQAAAWWRQNAPHLVRPGKAFMFPVEVCLKEHDAAVS